MCALVFSYSLPKPNGIMYLLKKDVEELFSLHYTKQLVSGTGASPGNFGGDIKFPCGSYKTMMVLVTTKFLPKPATPVSLMTRETYGSLDAMLTRRGAMHLTSQKMALFRITN